MNPTDLPCYSDPFYRSSFKLVEKFKSYQNNPDSNTKETIVQLLDRCFEEYENTLSFLHTKVDNQVSLEISQSYIKMRTLDNWHANLPGIISHVKALELGQNYVNKLTNMINDKRYTPTF